MSETHEVTWTPSGRGKSQCPPNKNYPKGVEADISKAGSPSCIVELPYPAPECGFHSVKCRLCGASLSITAAGRVDDPVSVRFPCIYVAPAATA